MKPYFYKVKLLQRLFAFYINSSIHVSLAVCALVGVTGSQLAFMPDVSLLMFVFFATITGYNFTKYAPVAKLHHRSLTPSLRIIQVFSLLSFGAMCYFGLQLSLEAVFVTIPFLMITLGYAVPFLKGSSTLRTLPGLKIIVIGICWAGVTVVLSSVHHKVPLGWTSIPIILQRVLFVIAITIPFEIRDLHYDSTALKTLPQLVGYKNSRYIGALLVLMSTWLVVFQEQVELHEVLSSVLTGVVAFVFILKTSKKQSLYYASFWIESIPIMWWGIVVLCNMLFG